jgi:hypothetical protein
MPKTKDTKERRARFGHTLASNIEHKRQERETALVKLAKASDRCVKEQDRMVIGIFFKALQTKTRRRATKTGRPVEHKKMRGH